MHTLSPQRLWIASDNTLVTDGHPKARVLFARAGQKLAAKVLSQFANAGDFFPGVVGEVANEEPAAEAPKRRGRPPKSGIE